MNRLRNFFWLCSGSDTEVIQECPGEHSKYAGIGATIFFTGLFAALAGSYALYTIFDNYIAATGFGLIWGAMIFNLDRYIVSSMKKKASRKEEFYLAAPRFLLAVLISLVIAKPLELKIFEKEIDNELSLMKEEAEVKYRTETNALYAPRIAELNQQINDLKTEIIQKTKVRDTLRMIAQKEADGTGGTMLRNAGPIYRIKKRDADQAELELSAITSRNQTLIREKETAIASLEQERDIKIAGMISPEFGLAGRLEALSRLTDQHAAIAAAHWFIILLFIAVETAPVLVKLISDRGRYDHILTSRDYASKARMITELATINAKAKRKAQKLTPTEKAFIEDELELAIHRA